MRQSIMTNILIKKSDDDIPVYQVYRVTEVKGRLTQYELVLTTQDFQQVMRIIIEW